MRNSLPTRLFGGLQIIDLKDVFDTRNNKMSILLTHYFQGRIHWLFILLLLSQHFDQSVYKNQKLFILKVVKISKPYFVMLIVNHMKQDFFHLINLKIISNILRHLIVTTLIY
jgi:hypothetical protein